MAELCAWQVKELEEPLEYIAELPAQVQLTAAGLFVQQHFFFAAIRSVHTEPDLLMVSRPRPFL